MSWEIGIPSDDPLAALQHVVLLVSAALALVLIVIAIRRRRRHAQQNDQHQFSPTSSEQLDSDNDASDIVADHDESLKRACMVDADDLTLDDIPAFSSLPVPNETYEPAETADTTLETGTADDVSSLLFRLLGTKARICELERAEQNSILMLESTHQVLEQLKGSLEDSSVEFQEEFEDMRDLIAGARLASRHSFENALELKEIIDMQCNLLSQGSKVKSGEYFLAKQSYIESIDASLERRVKVAERRESELALGKERIMALRRQMLKIREARLDSTQMQSKTKD